MGTRLVRSLPVRENVVVDDVRKPQEYLILQEAGFDLIRVDIDDKTQRERILLKYPRMDMDLLHDYTETALDMARFDRYLDGGKAFRDLKIDIDQIVHDLERRGK